MYRIERLLRAAIYIIPVLAFCSFSPEILSWEADKRAPWVGTMVNGPKCDGGQIPFGPFDYLQRDRLPAELQVVEDNHFTDNVESLRGGVGSTALDDLHYTLQAWPNHHRALNTSVRYRLQHRGKWVVQVGTYQGGYPAECYLQRAMKFSPNDPKPYMLYGLLMHQMKQYQKALFSYRVANRLVPEDIQTQYNMGLTLVALRKYKEAAEVARKVYSADFPLPGLKNKLIAVKHWEAEPSLAESKGAVPERSIQTKPAAKEATQPEAALKDDPSGLTESQLAALKKAMQTEADRKTPTATEAAELEPKQK